mmetsp:Transcript_15241/g.31435  ORF Transcript_15241/g.31435 Transcript_15241/m.31435 type:complete len:84 (+) Transcript_15241:1619-1870(+)
MVDADPDDRMRDDASKAPGRDGADDEWENDADMNGLLPPPLLPDSERRLEFGPRPPLPDSERRLESNKPPPMLPENDFEKKLR